MVVWEEGAGEGDGVPGDGWFVCYVEVGVKGGLLGVEVGRGHGCSGGCGGGRGV